MQKLLNAIETYGNKIPHPSLMFACLALLIIIVSAITELFGYQAIHPIKQHVITSQSLMSAEGLRFILTSMVKNFTQFAPLGIVIVAMLGIGIAEKSGLIHSTLSRLAKQRSPLLLTFSVALTGILSSLGADSGYVVLIPMSALLFKAAGLSPMAGLATAFAGVSAGFSANFLVGPIDAVLAGISTEAVQILHPQQSVSATANWYFNIASTVVLALVITAVSAYRQWPSIDAQSNNFDEGNSIKSTHENADFSGLALYSALFIAAVLALTLPSGAALRHPETGSLTQSPFIQSIVIIIALYFAGAGFIFGKKNQYFTTASDVIEAMEDTLKTLASYMVMMFFAAQFIAYFNWSNIGLIIAIDGANWLKQAQLHSSILLLAFIVISAGINLFIGSSSAKWALMAPIFIPMLSLLNISPEAAQVAYRIGDSSTNIITPMMPYFALVLAFAQQHNKKAGMGTLMAMMLPYSAALLMIWPIMLMLWLALGIPLGL